jgi:hypothetical protein
MPLSWTPQRSSAGCGYARAVVPAFFQVPMQFQCPSPHDPQKFGVYCVRAAASMTPMSTKTSRAARISTQPVSMRFAEANMSARYSSSERSRVRTPGVRDAASGLDLDAQRQRAGVSVFPTYLGRRASPARRRVGWGGSAPLFVRDARYPACAPAPWASSPPPLVPLPLPTVPGKRWRWGAQGAPQGRRPPPPRAAWVLAFLSAFCARASARPRGWRLRRCRRP